MINFNVILIYKKDFEEREKNYIAVIDHLINYHNIPEDNILKYEWKEEDGEFHRTKHINDMIKKSDKRYNIIWDVDIFITKRQLMMALNMLNNGYELVYPYDGRFYDISSPDIFYNKVCNSEEFEYRKLSPGDNSKGGIYIIDKDIYIGEDEGCMGWGYEDDIRYELSKKLGHKIARSEGICFHLYHPRPVENNFGQKYINVNKQRLEKILLTINDKILKEWVNDTWLWKINIAK